ncbi:hypothetical protein NQ036_03600 [Brevibacterium sp. 91QC2O2]|uniref:hypothetical protein n=1 Tax=Brevibacterium TaxID=1696 RepID=UPI00211BEE1F|nr:MULTISPECIES: hypothetical protein [unclassified Brevibacterium]MCQ9367331.1 hypothetical protein [Brevibacterium sp. 91QC2O2]MCQ9384656.1 hypothetical protein [Brevibacterium sp. 68QC2CO]
MQLLKSLGGPAGLVGGVVWVFLYFRKTDRELRDEQRADNDSLRKERDELIERIRQLNDDNEHLRNQLRERP